MSTVFTNRSGSGNNAAEEVAASKPVEWLARLGLVSRGVVWLVIGLLALEIAVGSGAEADRKGALRAIDGQPFGHLLLVALVIGFAGYAVWRLLEAAVGHQSEDGAKRTVKRIASAARGLLYASFAYSTIAFLAGGGGGSGDKTKPLTARLMSHPGGRELVGALGLAVTAGGLTIAVRGLREKFLKKLKPLPPRMQSFTEWVGKIGLVGRGLVIALIGWFLLDAAISFDPKKARGLDQSFKTLADQPFGTVLLIAAGLGLVTYALWSFIEARYRKI